ncbi:MAG: hypothetical protein IKY19_04175 [Bacteroidaceae bacterium]|nr:hypothetical protein [Bacteroidaceae bacterium]
MKKFLMTALAVCMMAGTAVATEKVVLTEVNVATMANDNVLEKLVALIKDYTKQVEAAETMEKFDAVYKGFEQAMTEFAEKNAEEIAAFDKNLTEEQGKKYKADIEKVVKQFQKAVEKKAMQFLGE